MAAQAPQVEAGSLDRRIAAIVQELLREQGKDALADRVSPQASFERDLGLGSLDLVELVVRCEARLEIEVPDEIAEQADTAAGWAKAIEQGAQESTARSAYRIVAPAGDPAPLPVEAKSLAEVLRWHAEKTPGRVHAHVLEGGAGRGITCAQILDAATLLARGLAAQGIRRDDRVAILLPNSSDFFEAFFGVMLAGAVAVPIYPPTDTRRLVEYVERQAAILDATDSRGVIVFDQVRPIAKMLRAKTGGILGAASVGTLKTLGRRAGVPLPAPSATALVQMTSGSTGEPKAVPLTHAAVLANLRAIGERLKISDSDAVVSWLPLSSDFGLVGCWLFSLYHGAPLTLLSPREFFERPESWLWAIHDSRATLSAAPNFAYELCTRQVPLWALEGINLSGWRAAVVAGEMISRSTVQRFAARLAPMGFRPESMLPAYGLAEATVALSMAEPGSGARCGPDGFYSVGRPLAGREVRVAEGQLEFREAGSDAAAWVSTGDLGFIRDGEIHVTGRAKDAIQRAGRALVPELIEWAASCVPGVQRDGVAAFGVRDAGRGTERLVVAAESAAANKTERERVIAGIQEAVVDSIGEGADEIHLIPVGALARTPNRKLRRGRARELYLAGRLHDRGTAVPVQMARLWRENFGALTLMGAGRIRRRVGGALRVLLARALGAAGVKHGSSARRIVRVLGRGVSVQGELPRGVLFAANRCGPFDALAVLAAANVEVRFAGEEALFGAPGWLRAALEKHVIRTDAEIRAALAKGVVVQFPDSAAGADPLRCRYRLKPLSAAASAAPLALHEIRNQTRILAGKPIGCSGSPIDVRDRLRTALANLYA
jgi:acyl carrier protein